MPRAARLQLHGLDVEKLREALSRNKAQNRFYTRKERRKIVEETAGVIPEGFAEEAYEIAVDLAALAAFQLVDAENSRGQTTGLFAPLTIRETVKLPDGTEKNVEVHGLKHILRMTEDEFDTSESREKASVIRHARGLNAKRTLRNDHAKELGYRPGPLPFPEYEEDDRGGEDRDEDDLPQAGD